MSILKGKEWNDDLDGIVASVEGCGGSLTVEARRLIDAVEREEMSFDNAIELYARFIKGEISEQQIYQG